MILDIILYNVQRVPCARKLVVDLLKPRIPVGDSRRTWQGGGNQVLSGVIITNGFICIIIRGKYVT